MTGIFRLTTGKTVATFEYGSAFKKTSMLYTMISIVSKYIYIYIYIYIYTHIHGEREREERSIQKLLQKVLLNGFSV